MKTSIRSLLIAISSTKSYSAGTNHQGRVILHARWLLACALLLMAATSALADCPGDPDFTKKTVGELLVCLDDNNFFNRNDASIELTGRVAKLTEDEWTMVAGVLVNTSSLEQQRRVERVIETFVIGEIKAPSAKAAIDLVEVGATSNLMPGSFYFGKFHGNAGAQNPVLAGLVRESIFCRNKIKVGDTAQAIKGLNGLQKFINDLSPNDFKSLNLMDSNNQPVDKKAALKAIDAAKAFMRKAELELRNWGDFPNPEDLVKPVQIGAAGPVDLGKTVAMNLQAIVTPGTLDYSWTDEDLAYGPPPNGFVAYGPMFDIQVYQDLQVSGAVSFSIQYGDSSGNAYGITDPTQLAIVRLANDAYQLLGGFNDLGQHTITGIYQPDSSPGLDQFGEFMLVAPMSPGAAGIHFVQAGQQAVIVYSADSQ